VCVCLQVEGILQTALNLSMAWVAQSLATNLEISSAGHWRTCYYFQALLLAVRALCLGHLPNIWLQCAEFNPEEDHPKSQDVHVGANFADLSARISVPPSVYNSYGGRMAIESENYLVSDQSLRGNQTWIWTNKDNTKQCRGVDHIIGLLGRYPLPIAVITLLRGPPTEATAQNRLPATEQRISGPGIPLDLTPVHA
jgi:hypothetical protein